MATLMDRAGVTCRTCASALIAGLWRKRSIGEVNARIAELPLRDQWVITGGVLVALFLLALLAAQFGWVAMLGYWLAVIAIVN